MAKTKTKAQEERKFEDYITEIEAEQLTGLGRTMLYLYRVRGTIRWAKGATRRIRYHKGDLLKLMGF